MNVLKIACFKWYNMYITIERLTFTILINMTDKNNPKNIFYTKEKSHYTLIKVYLLFYFVKYFSPDHCIFVH